MSVYLSQSFVTDDNTIPTPGPKDFFQPTWFENLSDETLLKWWDKMKEYIKDNEDPEGARSMLIDVGNELARRVKR